MTRGRLQQRAGLPGLDGGGAAIAVPPIRPLKLCWNIMFRSVGVLQINTQLNSTQFYLKTVAERLKEIQWIAKY